MIEINRTIEEMNYHLTHILPPIKQQNDEDQKKNNSIFENGDINCEKEEEEEIMIPIQYNVHHPHIKPFHTKNENKNNLLSANKQQEKQQQQEEENEDGEFINGIDHLSSTNQTQTEPILQKDEEQQLEDEKDQEEDQYDEVNYSLYGVMIGREAYKNPTLFYGISFNFYLIFHFFFLLVL